MTITNHDFESALIERENIQLHALMATGVRASGNGRAWGHGRLARFRCGSAGDELRRPRRGSSSVEAVATATRRVPTTACTPRSVICELGSIILNSRCTSWGGATGGRSHSKMPPRTRVGSVVTYDPVLPPFAKGAVSMLEEADLNERVVVINRDISGLEPEIVEAMKDQSEWSHLRKLAIPLAAELAALNNFTPSKKWESVAAALIVGERSHAVEPYGPVFDRVSERIPQASVTVLPGQGHLAHVEDPTLLGTAIGTILTKGVST